MENIENTEAWRDGYEKGFVAGFDNCNKNVKNFDLVMLDEDDENLLDNLVKVCKCILDLRDKNYIGGILIDVDMFAYACAEQHLSITDAYRAAAIFFGSIPFSYEAYTKEGKSND